MSEMISMADINGKIKEQVKVSFFNLLPDDKFQELVDAEIKAFFESTMEQFEVVSQKENTSWNGSRTSTKLRTPISPFRAIVWAQCREQVDEKLKKIFGESGFSVEQYWDNGSLISKLSPNLEELLRKQANDLAATFFQTMFAQAFASASSQIADDISKRIREGF